MWASGYACGVLWMDELASSHGAKQEMHDQLIDVMLFFPHLVA